MALPMCTVIIKVWSRTPVFQLSKKHNAVNYHICRETVAADAMRVGKEDTDTNCSDALTKLMPYSKKQKLLGKVQYDY